MSCALVCSEQWDVHIQEVQHSWECGKSIAIPSVAYYRSDWVVPGVTHMDTATLSASTSAQFPSLLAPGIVIPASWGLRC